MMETRLWAALCALLLVNLGSADLADDSHIAPSNASNSAADEVATEAPAAVPVSRLDSNGSAVTSASPTTSLRVTSSLSSNISEGQNIPLTPEKMKNNGPSTIPPSEVTTPERHLTQPPSPPSGSHTPTTHMDLTFSTTSAGHSVPVNTTSSTATSSTTTSSTTMSSTTTSSTTTFSITQSNQSTHNQTHLFPSATTHELANQDTTTTTTAIIQSSSTSSTSSYPEPTRSVSQTHTSPQNTVPTEANSKTSTAVHQRPTTPPPSGPSIQPRVHVDTSSKLKVGGDTTMVHESPTLDPLLAGLVSAFIITAVIITLLLFLKLRRRDNRPEFRRLQDLPMDDMEDTPLSMYSY